MRSNLFIVALCGLIGVACPPAFGQGVPATTLSGCCRTARSGEVQGHDQGAGRVRRSAAGDRSQSRGDRLDRRPAEELRLRDRAAEVRVRAATAAIAAAARPSASPAIASGEIRPGAGGARLRGVTAPTSVNDHPEAHRREARELNSQPSAPGPREEVYCTKIGATRPGEMYVIGATWMA